MKKLHWFFYICKIFNKSYDDEFTLKIHEVNCPECLDRLEKESDEKIVLWSKQ